MCNAHFCPRSNTFGVSQQIFVEVSNIKFHENLPVRGALMHTYRRRCISNRIGAFSVYANSPKGPRVRPLKRTQTLNKCNVTVIKLTPHTTCDKIRAELHVFLMWPASRPILLLQGEGSHPSYPSTPEPAGRTLDEA